MDYLELVSNPDYEDEYLELVEPKPRRRRKNPAKTEAEFEPSTLTWLLLPVGAYLVWCAIKRAQTGKWSWQPWKSTLGRRLLPAPVISQNSPPYHIDAGVHSLGSIQPVSPSTNFQQENISLIVP